MTWYSVVALFAHPRQDDGDPVIEERVVLFKADGVEDAMAKAELDATRYAEDNDAEWTGSMSAFVCDDGPIADGSEVFSMMRRIACTPAEFDQRFFSGVVGRDEEMDDGGSEGV